MLRKLLGVLSILAIAFVTQAQTNATFTVGAYNVENWNSITRDGQTNQPKPQAAKDAVVAVIIEARPDILGLEEMGKTNDLAELRAMLAAKGLDYPHTEHVQAADKDRHVCLLSRYPIVSRQSRTDYTYELAGHTTANGRGILDVTVQVNPQYAFRALVVHLKSKRQVDGSADQAQVRLEEAKLLRAHIGKALKQDANENLIVMGDFNDTPEAAPIKAIVGEPPFALFPLPCKTSRGYEGTHLWRGRGEWSRIDYLMTSPGMSNEFIEGSAKIREGRADAEASDHRMVYASFQARDIGPAPQPKVVATAKPAKPIAISQTSAPVLYAVIIGLFAVVIVLAVLLMYTRRQRMEKKD
jgi:endonuclease/exonuclease/phosphatase family metal-dependent hydrolase